MSGAQTVTGLEEVRDRLGIGIAAVVAVAGWALTVIVTARWHAARPLDFFLVPPLPLAVVGTVTALAAWRRSINVAAWLAAIVATATVTNLLLSVLGVRARIWEYLLPPARWGTDFVDGLYNPAQAFSVARSGWPPFTLIVGWPFTLFEIRTAYAIAISLTAVAALGAALLSATLAMYVLQPEAERDTGFGRGCVDAHSLGVVLAFWLLTSYGFMYEMYRGNVNLIALVFGLLAVLGAIRLPRSPWWPAIALAVAVNLKLYPVILVVVLFWRYRLRAVVPVVVTNVVLLLVAGPANLWRLLLWLTKETPGSRDAVYGDMGASGMAAILKQTASWAPQWTGALLFAVPLALWALTAVLLIRRGWSDSRAVLLASASVTPMAVIPTLSNDYKLVLFVLPLAVLAVFLAGASGERGRLTWCLGFGVLGYLMVFLARSTAFHGYELLGSKYSLAVLVQILILLVAWRLDAAALAQTGAASGGGEPARMTSAGREKAGDEGAVA